MISLIGCWLLLIVVCSIIGTAILQLIHTRQVHHPGDRFIVSVWLGVAVISNLFLATSLVAPVSPTVSASIAASLVLVSLASRRTRSEIKEFVLMLSPRLVVGALCLALGVAVFVAQPVIWYDAGLYHFGMVRWLSQYGAVPGLALIHGRFGIASAWFALAAPFEAGALEARTSALTGGLALLLSALHFLICVARCLTKRGRLSDWMLVCASALVLPTLIYWGLPVSTSPSYPPIILAVITAWLMLVILEWPEPRLEKGKSFALDARLIPFILSVAATTIKLNAAPLVVITGLFYLFGHGFRGRRLVTLLSIGLLLSAPMIGYQVITTGCPFFPMSVMCLDLPWTLDQKEIVPVAEAVKMWARWGGFAPPDATSFNWLWRGWLWLGTTPKSALALLALAVVALAGVALMRVQDGKLKHVGRWLLVLGGLGATWLMITRARNILMICLLLLTLLTYRQGFTGKNWLMALGLSGMALVLSLGPDLIFGLGYVAILFACFAIAWRDAWPQLFPKAGLLFKVERAPQTTLVVLLIGAGLGLGLCRVLVRNNQPQLRIGALPSDDARFPLLVPPRLPEATTVRVRMNNIEYQQPTESDQCWATEIPCACYPLADDVVLRQPERGMAAGFVHGQRFSTPVPDTVSK